MVRTGIVRTIMWAIVPIALTLIVFATVDHDNGGKWISLAFIWIAYLIASVTCLSKSSKNLSVLNWTLYYCALVYFITVIIAAVLFLYVYPDYPRWSFAVQLLLLVTFFLVFGFSYISNQKTKEQIQEFVANDSRVKQWRAKVALLQSSNPCDEIKELSDLLSITPITSTPEVASIDDEISSMIESDIPNIAQIISKIKERNILLKFNSN